MLPINKGGLTKTLAPPPRKFVFSGSFRSTPYRSSVSCVSALTSINSGAAFCIRNASSYELIRLAISVSFCCSKRIRLRELINPYESFCISREYPLGVFRFKTGSPSPRNTTPSYVDGKKPLVQLETPPELPRPADNTTYAGRSFVSQPNP